VFDKPEGEVLDAETEAAAAAATPGAKPAETAAPAQS